MDMRTVVIVPSPAAASDLDPLVHQVSTRWNVQGFLVSPAPIDRIPKLSSDHGGSRVIYIAPLSSPKIYHPGFPEGHLCIDRWD